MTAIDRYRTLEREPLVSTAANGSVRGSFAAVSEIFRHREMLSLLVRRDLKARYKDSALGVVWSLIRPLTQLLIYYVVLGKFLGAERGIPDFALYIFCGLTIYGLLSEIVAGTTNSVLSNGSLIKKVYLPREVFPIASVGSALFNFLMQLIILFLATLVTGRFPLHWDLLYAIPGVLVVLVYGLGFGLLFSALNVYLRDIGYLIEVLLLILLWGSPIVYAWHQVQGVLGTGLLSNIYADNPVTLAVLSFHKAFWMGGSDAEYPDQLALRLVVAIAIGFVLLFSFQRVFARLQGNFAQEI